MYCYVKLYVLQWVTNKCIQAMSAKMDLGLMVYEMYT